jgi:molybdopterin-biosynthesis enzyme MoeA-like protein
VGKGGVDERSGAGCLVIGNENVSGRMADANLCDITTTLARRGLYVQRPLAERRLL